MTRIAQMIAELRRAVALVDAGQAREALAVYRALLVEAASLARTPGHLSLARLVADRGAE